MKVEPVKKARARVAERLQARREEIEQATLTRVCAVSESSPNADPEYAHGLRTAVSAALEHGLTAMERSEERPPPVPPVLLAQARLAARSRVNLDTVLRRYFAGYTLLGDFVIQEAEDGGLLHGAALQRLLRGQAALFDRLLASVSEEYAREQRGHLRNAQQRRIDRVRRLLAGEPLDTSELEYPFDGHHLGIVVVGPRAGETLSAIATALDQRLLVVERGEEPAWAWLGGRRAIAVADVERVASAEIAAAGLAMALGEPAEGISGWRLTHQQARAALPIAARLSPGIARYGDVALLASMLRDDLLVASLQKLYLAPLAQQGDDGEVLSETLKAYLAADRNVSSAAAAIGVNRHTVTKRLQTIEQRLDRPLGACMTELDVALRLQDLGSPTSS